MYYRKFECHILYQSNQSTFRILDLNIFLFMEEKKDLKCDLGILWAHWRMSYLQNVAINAIILKGNLLGLDHLENLSPLWVLK